MKFNNEHPIWTLIEEFKNPIYTQTYGQLCATVNCYCAEGLMCEVYRQLTNKGEWKSLSYDGQLDPRFYLTPDGHGYCVSVPGVIIQYFFNEDDLPFSLISLNDDMKLTLPEIGERIEQWVIGQNQ